MTQENTTENHTETDEHKKVTSFVAFVHAEHSIETVTHFNEYRDLCLQSAGKEKIEYGPALSELLFEQTPIAANYLLKRVWETINNRKHSSEYQSSDCSHVKALVVGAGISGLRTAIEFALLGCRVTVIEKRLEFTRLNILHMWPFVVQDLRALGAKEFWGKFGIGGLDCAPIWRLQVILLKISLLLGVEVIMGVEYVKSSPRGGESHWTAEVEPKTEDISFNVLVGAEGEHSKISEEFEFEKKKLNFSTAIGITANFDIIHSPEEDKMKEGGFISYLNRDFFSNLKDNHDIVLENLVYYRSDTHYFVTTAAKKSLFSKGVLREDKQDHNELVSSDNIDVTALCDFMREIATAYGLPKESPFVQLGERNDVCLFDFSCKTAVKDPSMMVEREGKRIFVTVAGDSALNPFWPQGTGAGHACLSALDAAWCLHRISPHLKEKGQNSDAVKEILEEHHKAYKMLETATGDHVKHGTMDPSTQMGEYNFPYTTKDLCEMIECNRHRQFALSTRSAYVGNYEQTHHDIHNSPMQLFLSISCALYKGVGLFENAASCVFGVT
ncbi:protein MICAL-3-like [Planoprotostelium fungivorum]|uniref:Protein MICAL-3-like n=1 Tax=Planoprotostelium fungivorum TaxID=1890364 RepID=A0A2P6N0S8_9EUKA|nr:protein MICAL-3-like [Planoprotostelium fungivorum]